MHDLLGLEYINSTMCHYLKLKGEKLKNFPCYIPSFFSLISGKKQDVSLPQSVVWKEVHAFMCVCAYKRREGRRYERNCLIALFKCHFTAG